MPAGGTITLRVACCSISADNPRGLVAGDYVTLAIADTGVGMSPEVQAHLFQPFFTTKPKGRGTGLGLATCAVIVRNSQGAIEFSSEPGVGTTFTLLFPRIASLGAPPSVDDEEHLIEGREHILLVEDDEAIRTVTQAILESLGYRVTTVAGGIDAIAACRASDKIHYDLLLTDVIMPDMDGRDLADQVAAMNPGMRVLFMSGYVGDPGILQAVQAAGGRFLEKPFTRTSLGRRVRESLDIPNDGLRP
jgi:two-component system, cell cycle sensor histidine kinase and response regulator CckA